MDSTSIESSRACSKCGFANPAVNRRCGSCGEILDSELLVLQAQIETIVANSLEAQLKDKYKDQKLVEIETTQLIASRLSEWAKILGFFVAIPVAILAVILGVLGLSNYADFKARINTVQKDATEKLAEAQRKAQDLNNTGESLRAEYEKAKVELQSFNQLSSEVRGLASRVEKIEKVQFSGSTPATQSRLEEVLHQFQEYFHALGLGKLGKSPLHVIIKPSSEMSGAIAYTQPNEGNMFVGKEWANDPDLLLREYSHVALFSLHPDFQKNSRLAQNWEFSALESGLATYYPCSFNGRSEFGSASSGHGFSPWHLQNQRSFAGFSATPVTYNQDGAEIWGGAFWALRQSLGKDVADKLILSAWKLLQPDDAEGNIPAKFGARMLQADKTEGGAHSAEIRGILDARGVNLSSM